MIWSGKRPRLRLYRHRPAPLHRRKAVRQAGMVGFGALVAMVAAGPDPAVAQCSPAAPTSGSTVTCSGAVPSFTTSGLGSLTVNIVPGTSFNGQFSASTMNLLSVSNNQGNMQAVAFDSIVTLNFTTSGNINSGLSITNASTANVTNTGNINQPFGVSGVGAFNFSNAGILNNGLNVTNGGTNAITNTGMINQTFAISGNSTDNIDNRGTINSGINKIGGGSLAILNEAGATINQGIFVSGSSNTTINNFGTIQGTAVALGTGNDLMVNNGTVNGNVNMGDGNNTFLMQSGIVNGSVLSGIGQDSVVVSAGQITGFVRTGGGNDTLLWTGGLIGGIDMGAGDDHATFVNLTTANLKTITIDGGLGNDTLTWVNTQGDHPERLLNWELIELTQGSQLTMNNDLVLGDPVSGTGTLTIDATSTVFGGQNQTTILPAVPGQLVNVINAGTIDLTNGGSSTTDYLQINGNYTGQNGRLLLQTVLAGNAAPSDRLIISGNGAQGSGNTTIGVTNVGGQGALTAGNGILVVQATNGATTTPSAFNLSGRVAAGAFEYQLFRGGDSAATANNWYLRNFVPQSVCPFSGKDCAAVTFVPPGSGGSGGGGGGSGGGGGGGVESLGESSAGALVDPSLDPGIEGGGLAGVILYRPEVALEAAVPAVSRAAVRATLGTFHEREGEQAFASGDGAFGAGWARIFGGHYAQSWSGDVTPSFSGDIWGVQVGLPVFAWEHSSGEKDRAGLFFGYAMVNGSVNGFAIGQQNTPVGTLGVNSYSFGGYWTHFWPRGGYFDAVVMNSWLTESNQSVLNVSTSTPGRIFTTSLELGYPIALPWHLAIEPQAQFIYQHEGFNLLFDPYSQISFAQSDVFTGRFGARLVGNFVTDKAIIRPFLLTNLWHDFNGNDTVAFNTVPIVTSQNVTAIEVGGGVSVSMSKWLDAYAKVSYTTDIDGNMQSAISGKVGFRLVW
jgi:outer membrane autotransporter protein